MKIAAAIRHVHFEDLGTFEDVLVSRGAEVQYLDAGLHDLSTLQADDPDLLVILGGPNGAGKTTAARRLLPKFPSIQVFLNADEFMRAISPENPESAAFAAGRKMLARIKTVDKTQKGCAMGSMTSQEIREAIRVALGEVSRALAWRQAN